MALDIMGVSFDFVASIVPDHNPDGTVKEFMRQDEYCNVRHLALNAHGAGPFCHFRVAADVPFAGLYALTVNGAIMYIGKTERLSRRFGENYGNISPSDCFKKVGQLTNCFVNGRILEHAKQSHRIQLWFCQIGASAAERERLEAQLIASENPPWNGRLRRTA